MSSNIEFLFDFASPNAYLSYHVLAGVAERHGATLTLTPVLLGGLFKLTNNQAPMVAFAPSIELPASLRLPATVTQTLRKRWKLTLEVGISSESRRET